MMQKQEFAIMAYKNTNTIAYFGGNKLQKKLFYFCGIQ
jgi:hypothetical protein